MKCEYQLSFTIFEPWLTATYVKLSEYIKIKLCQQTNKLDNG